MKSAESSACNARPRPAPAPQEASVTAPASTIPTDRRTAGNPPEETHVISISQSSPHARPGVTPLGRERVAGIFKSRQVENLATALLIEAKRNLEEGGTRRLITHAIDAAASGVMNNGRSKQLAELQPADVARALESMIVEVEIEREAERARQEDHKQAQQAADAEWNELLSAVAERRDAVTAELAKLVEMLLGEDDITDQRQALEKHARDLAAKVSRFQAFANDRRANFWAPYDTTDSRLDVILEDTAKRLGIPAPEAPIEVPAA